MVDCHGLVLIFKRVYFGTFRVFKGRAVNFFGLGFGGLLWLSGSLILTCWQTSPNLSIFFCFADLYRSLDFPILGVW